MYQALWPKYVPNSPGSNSKLQKDENVDLALLLLDQVTVTLGNMGQNTGIFEENDVTQCGSYSVTGYLCCAAQQATDCVCIQLNITRNWIVRESQNAMPVVCDKNIYHGNYRVSQKTVPAFCSLYNFL